MSSEFDKMIIYHNEIDCIIFSLLLTVFFISWLVQRGVSIYEVSKLLGHSDLKVTQIYAHLRQENLENAVNKF